MIALVCVRASVSACVIFLRVWGIKAAAGLCGLVASSSVNWLGYLFLCNVHFCWAYVKLHSHIYRNTPAGVQLYVQEVFIDRSNFNSFCFKLCCK